MGGRRHLHGFGGEIAIDLGTANTVVYARGQGIVLFEPSVIAIDERSGNVLAVGAEAKRMIGRTPAAISATRPLRHGVIADFDVAEQMLRHFMRRAIGSRVAHPRVILCVPSGLTPLERDAVEEAARAAGARAVYPIPGRLARGSADADLRAALEMFGETGAAGRYGWALANLGQVYNRRGDTPLAERTLRDAVRRLRATQEQGFLAEAERQLAEVLVKQGKLAEAERLVKEAQRRVGRGDAWTRASLLHALGVVRAAQGRTDEAETAFEDALASIEPTMYTILTNGVRASLESLRARATAPTQP